MLIERLYSADDANKELAKREILAAGTMAAKPLCSLLTDLLENPYPRFPKGEEEEASKALTLYSRVDVKTLSLDDMKKRSAIARKYFINSRLITDIVELLGQLKASAAIPNLVRIMRSRDLFAGPDGFGIEMVALTRIGQPAVPYLITALKEAKEIARRREDVNLSFVIDENEADEEEAGEITDSDESGEYAEEVKIRLHKILLRAVMVLGQIPDEEGLSFLEGLLKETDDESVISEIKGILDRTKNGTSVGNEIRQASFEDYHK
jgi:HEAT repeat protein